MKINYFEATPEENHYVTSLLNDVVFRQEYSGPTTVASMRSATANLIRSIPHRHGNVEVEPCLIGNVRCERLVPDSADYSKLIIYLHGGGFVRGSLDLGRSNAISLASTSKIPVLAIGYRQAPEHPYPAASEDLLTVYSNLIEREYSADHVVVSGESAGGCLALSLPAWLEATNMPMPAGFAAISPMIDLSLAGASWHFNAQTDFVTREMARRLISLYIDDDQLEDPLAAPKKSSISNKSDYLLCVGTWESLLSEVERFANYADSAGAAVTLNLYGSMPHGFTRFDVPLARQVVADAGHWCANLLNAG